MSKKSPTLFDRFTYSLMMTFHYLSRLIPDPLWLLLGQGLGRFLLLVAAPLSRIAKINLNFAYGDEMTDNLRRDILGRNFNHYGVGSFEWLSMFRMNEARRQSLCDRIQIEGREHLDAARQAKGKLVLLSGHFGFWEYAAVKYASEINPLSFIVRRIENPLIEAERLYYHDRFGARILYKENGLREAIRGLVKGEDVLILADRKTRLHEGIPSTFFSRKTSTMAIAVSLAKKYDAALLPMFIVRGEKRGEHKLVFLPAIKVDDVSIDEGVQLQNDCLETMIRKHPDLWLWLHRKWKCYHEEIYRR